MQRRDSARQLNHILTGYFSCNTRFTFANGQTSKVDGTLRLFLNTSLPMLTFVDILEQGQAPILLSIDQTRNLHMTIEHTPQCEKVTCETFGMIRHAYRYPIVVMHNLISQPANNTTLRSLRKFDQNANLAITPSRSQTSGLRAKTSAS